MTNETGLAGLGCCAAAFLFSLLAVALPYWQTSESVTLEINVGLWRYCSKSGSFELCGDPLDILSTDDDKNSLRATRAMVLLGFFCTIGALAVSALLVFVMKKERVLGYVGGGLAITGGFFLMIGMAIYVDRLKTEEYDYSAGFAFDIMGWLVSWAAGCLMLVDSVMGSGKIGSM